MSFIDWFKNKVRIEPRSSTIFVKNNLDNNNLKVVEIGVDLGMNAYSLLNELPIQRLFLVDPYINGDDVFEKAKKLLEPFKDKIIFIRKYSKDAVDDIPTNMDFVYIDGNHDYNFVKRDIELYYPKLRTGGVLGGHDFTVNYPGVCRAVTEFVMANNIKLYGGSMDWLIIKK